MKMNILIAIILLLVFLPLKSNAQMIKVLNDPSIVAQHKRMVYEQWGDWRPYPKYFLGIQTNFAYATVWGIWAPSRNRAYKRGDDIRPLKPDGLEVKRLVETKIQENQAKMILEEATQLQKLAEKDFLHYTSTTVEADPLWVLFYRKKLRPLNQFPAQPGFEDLGLESQEKYNHLFQIGALDNLLDVLEGLKESYHQSRNMAMPRGKRILMYHDTLMGWRKFLDMKNSIGRKIDLPSIKNYNLNIIISNSNTGYASDKEIAEEVMQEFKHRF